MQPKDWIPIAGWFIVFILGIVSGGFVVPRLTAKKKIIDWGVLSENDLIPRELSEMLGIPVIIQVGDSKPASLSTVQIRIGSGGNEVVENVNVVVNFNQSSAILNVRPIEELGEFGKHVKWMQTEKSCRIEIEFLNQGQSFDLEFLLSDYEPASVNVDGAAPGIQIRRREAGRWEVPTSFLQGITLTAMGIRYDPSVATMNQIAEEIRGIRRQLRNTQL